MIVVRRSVIVNAPVEKVYEFCASPHGFEMQFPFKVRWIKKPLLWTQGAEIEFDYKFLGCWLKHRAKVTECHTNVRFVDEAVGGLFTTFKHEHDFHGKGNTTIYTDTVAVALGLGKIGDILLGKFVIQRVFKRRHQRLCSALAR
jgi:ligand-binding SRPBCC domain-containing protein